MDSTRTRCLTILCAVALNWARAHAGPDIDEATSTSGDAGGLPKTAITPRGVGNVFAARGGLSLGLVQGDVVDMYLFYVGNPAIFSATTVGYANFDTMLYLCQVVTEGEVPSVAGIVTGNDDSSGVLQSTVTFPNLSWPAGIYAVVVTPYRVMPVGLQTPFGTAGGAPVQRQLLNYSATGLMTPTEFASSVPISLWLGNATSAGSYAIGLFGTALLPLLTGNQACGTNEGSCLVARPGSIGCDNVNCCTIVCTQDPYCCNASWDENCAQIAIQNCSTCQPAEPPTCPADLNADGSVDGSDLGSLLAAWGPCN